MALATYLGTLQRRPLSTKAASAALIFCIGDATAQRITSDSAVVTAGGDAPPWFDGRRALSFASFAAVVYAPTQHFWFGWMERHVAVGWSAAPMRQAAARVALHSAVYAPFSIVALFAWMGLASKRYTNLGECLSEVAAPSRLGPVWLAGGAFWIPTMLGVYRFVPLHGRVVVTSACNVLWGSYLSLKAAGQAARHREVARCPRTQAPRPTQDASWLADA